MLEQFREELTRQGKSQNTIETYCRNVRLFLDWLTATTGEPFNNRISVFDGREYRSYLVNVKKQKPNTVNAKLESVQQYADFLYNQGQQTRVTIERQKAVQNIDVKILDKSSLYKCRRWANNYASPRDAAVFEVLLNTAIRESELTALTMDDLQLSERKGKLIIRSGKGGKYREIPLNVDARNALQRYLDVRPAAPEGNLFLGQRGPLTRSAVIKIVQKIGQKGAGTSELTPHVLRHTCLTRMARNGIDLCVIANIAGHSDPQLTARYYVSTQDEDREKAVDGLEF